MKRTQNVAEAVVKTRSSLSSWSAFQPMPHAVREKVEEPILPLDALPRGTFGRPATRHEWSIGKVSPATRQ
ncbi:hypothetical protein FRX31_012133, partial [Thalictrum thalictroides]